MHLKMTGSRVRQVSLSNFCASQRPIHSGRLCLGHMSACFIVVRSHYGCTAGKRAGRSGTRTLLGETRASGSAHV